MAYGILKVDTITFTDGGVDKSVPVSGLVQNPTFTGNITATGTISGNIIQGGTTVSGLTVTGTTANFASGVFTTQVSGLLITGPTVSATTGTFTSLTGTTTNGTTASFTTGNFTSLTGTTTTGTTANFASGVFTTQISGVTVIATTGTFTSLTGATTTMTSGVFALGTALLPSISFVSDPNTGIYSPGADQLAVATNGVERVKFGTTATEVVFNDTGVNYDFRIEGDTNANLLFVDASTDRIGIGTSSPVSLLSVGNVSTSAAGLPSAAGFYNTASIASSESTVGLFATETSAVDVGAILAFGGNTNNAVSPYPFAFIQGAKASGTVGNYSGYLRFLTVPSDGSSPIERARIRADGMFEVKGAGTSGSSPAFSVNGSAPADSFVIDSSGRLGIGTSSPQRAVTAQTNSNGASLLLFRTSETNNDYGGVEFGNHPSDIVNYRKGAIYYVSDGTGFGRGSIYICNDSAGDSNNVQPSDAKVVITSAGLVGIGTSSVNAGAMLHIAKNTTGNVATIRLSGNDGAGDGGAGAVFADNETVKWNVFTRRFSSANKLYISTTENDTTASKVTITEGGLVGIGTTGPSNQAHIYRTDSGTSNGALRLDGNGSYAGVQFAVSGTNYGSISSDTSNFYITHASTISFRTGASNNVGGTDRACIDSSGRLLVGTSTALSNIKVNATAGQTPIIQLEGSNNSYSTSLSITNYNINSYGPAFALNASKGTQATPATVSSNGDLGFFTFNGYDGTNFIPGAHIAAFVDGTPGTNDMPGRLVFSTTADGASSPTERLRITSTGQVRLAGAGITFNGDTAAANELDDYEEGTWTPTAGAGITINSGTPAYSGVYTKIGRVVNITIIQTAGNITVTAGAIVFSSLPFTPGTQLQACSVTNGNPNISGTGLIYNAPGTGSIYIGFTAVSQTSLTFTGTYFI